MQYTKNLTSKQKRVFDFINNYMKTNTNAPTITEIQSALGFRSTRSVSQYLEALRAKGYIAKNRNPRSIRLTGHQAEKASLATTLVPLLGMASCGTPEFFADDNIEEYVPVQTTLIKDDPKKYYLLKTAGTSMNKAGIEEGAIVLIKRKDFYEQGERVVAVVDDMATIKKLHKGDNAVMLMPESTEERHQPIIATEGAICGEVVCSIPFFNDLQGNIAYA